MGIEFAMKTLCRSITAEEFAGRRNSWSFWASPTNTPRLYYEEKGVILGKRDAETCIKKRRGSIGHCGDYGSQVSKQASEFCNQFYRTYFLTIEQEIFAVLTDTFHKPGFKLHALVLQHLFCQAESGALTEPTWDAATNSYPYPSNAAFVREFAIKLLSTSFPNMTAAEVTQLVNGLFESTNDLSAFKTHIRDFLIQSKEFPAQDNKDLYGEEAAVQILMVLVCCRSCAPLKSKPKLFYY